MSDLKETFKAFDESVLELIVSEAEKVIESQLRSAEVADRRATAYATASSATAVAAASVLANAYQNIGLFGAVALVTLVGFCVISAIFALLALRPGKIRSPGYSPDKWKEMSKKAGKVTILATIADQLNNRIIDNEKINSDRSDLCNYSFTFLILAFLSSIVIYILSLTFVIMARLLTGG